MKILALYLALPLGIWFYPTLALITAPPTFKELKLSHPQLTLHKSVGQMALHHDRTIHREVLRGHMVLNLNLTKEIEFAMKLKTRIVPLVHSFMERNNIHSQEIFDEIFSSEFHRNFQSLKDIIGALRRASLTPRQARWVPLLSLGLGVANSIGLALLAGREAADHRLLQQTTHRIDALTNVVARNAEDISELFEEQTEIIRDMRHIEREVIGNRVRAVLKALIDMGSTQLDTIIAGINQIIKGQVPLQLFPVDRLSPEFDTFKAKVKQAHLHPILSNVMSLYELPAQFAILTSPTEGITLSLILEIPLAESAHHSWDVIRPETSLLQFGSELWLFAPTDILLVGHGPAKTTRFAVVPLTYLDQCYGTHGPEGEICPAFPSLPQPRGCLPALFQRHSGKDLCSSFLTHWNSDTPAQFQDLTHGITLYSPRERLARLQCPGQPPHLIQLHGLQRATLPLSCVFSINDFSAINAALPSMTLEYHTALNDTQSMLGMVTRDFTQLNQTMTLSDLDQLARENGMARSHGKLTLQRARQLEAHPISRHVSRYGDWYGTIASIAIVLVIGIAVATTAGVIFLRRRRQRLVAQEAAEMERKIQHEAFILRHKEIAK